MAKVPDYTARAIDKYHAKFDRIAASLPKGYKQIIADNIGVSVNQYVNELVHADLLKRGLLPADDTTAADDDMDMPFS